MSKINIQLSIGEIYDKLAILTVKKNNITNKNKLENIKNEINELTDIVAAVRLVLNEDEREKEKSLFEKCIVINAKIWDQIDEMSQASKHFEKEPLYSTEEMKKVAELGVEIFNMNNKRFLIKKEIDKFFGSENTEEKSCI